MTFKTTLSLQGGQAPTQLEFTQAMTDFKGIVVI